MRAIRLPKLHEIQWLIEPTTELSHHILKRTSFRPKLNHSPKIYIGITKSTMNRPGMRPLNSLSSPQCAPLHGCKREGGSLHWIMLEWELDAETQGDTGPAVPSAIYALQELGHGWTLETSQKLWIYLDSTSSPTRCYQMEGPG